MAGKKADNYKYQSENHKLFQGPSREKRNTVTLINLYLTDYADNNKELSLSMRILHSWRIGL